MKQPDWIALLGDAMQHDMTILEVSEEVGITGLFKEILDDFLTDRQIAEDKEELLRNLPWNDVEGGRIYFKLSALQTFLEKQNFKHYNRTKIVQRIKDLGGDHAFFNLKNRGVNVWFIPTKVLPGVKELPLPELKKTPI
jgi:hypothetical protein